MTARELTSLRNELSAMEAVCAELSGYLANRTRTTTHEDYQIAETVTTHTRRLNATAPTGISTLAPPPPRTDRTRRLAFTPTPTPLDPQLPLPTRND